MAAMASSSSSAAQTCRGCHKTVVFVTEASGSVCAHCGTMVEEDDYRLTFREMTSFNSRAGFGREGYGWSTLQREASRMNQGLRLEGSRQRRPEVDAIARAILARFGRVNLLLEVQDLVFQVLTINQDRSKYARAADLKDESHPLKDDHTKKGGPSVRQHEQETSADAGEVFEGKKTMLRGEQAISRLAVAATFSILKKYDDATTLDAVCSVGDVAKVEQVVHSLRFMESLLGNTALLGTFADSPKAHIADIIAFLVKQTKLKPRDREVSPILPQDDESILESEEQHFVKEANVESEAFSILSLGLCDLCSHHGLNNRASKTTTKKDLFLCAWAILLLAMEAASSQICNQGKMAKAASKFKSSQNSGSTAANTQGRFTAAARTASEEVVKKRYVEISRMLTLYLEQLPWLSDEKPSTKEKTARKSKGRDKVAESKQHLASIKPFSRKVVARYLGDVIKLRRFIEFKLAKADSEWDLMKWSRFSSTEDQFHRIRQTVDGQTLIRNEELQHQLQQRNSAVILSSQDGILAAIDELLQKQNDLVMEKTQSSKLAASIGSTLLQLGSLEAMADELVDSLLFEKGEMESYVRSGEEVQLLQSLRVDKGDWDRETTPASPSKRSRSEEEEEEPMERFNVIDGKRTKALTEAEAARILSLL